MPEVMSREILAAQRRQKKAMRRKDPNTALRAGRIKYEHMAAEFARTPEGERLSRELKEARKNELEFPEAWLKYCEGLERFAGKRTEEFGVFQRRLFTTTALAKANRDAKRLK